MYRLYIYRNLADTSRDSDNIETIKDEFYTTLEKAKIDANIYIKNHFLHKDSKLSGSGDNWSTVDFCSYGAVIKISKVKVN